MTNPLTDEQIAQAVLEAEPVLLRGDVHTIYYGMEEVAGRRSGRPAIVCCVDHKRPVNELAAQGRPVVPRLLMLGGVEFATDVVEMPQPKDMRLRLDEMSVQMFAQADQRCWNCPIPGGVQIAPQGANWVGTLGAAVEFRRDGEVLYGAITNAHVTGLRGAGKTMHQPTTRHEAFGQVARVYPIHMGGEANYVDCALINVGRTDGPYAPLTHTVKPEQVDLGRINPVPVTSPQVGQAVRKRGRTTSTTTGRVIGIHGTSQVSYGSDGSALFRGQNVFRGDRGDFSQSGDSGSLIMDDENRPHSLLFAGGGGTTLGNPISRVIEALEVKFYGMRV